MKQTNKNTSLLFVDDEPNMLSSLKRWSETFAGQWDCHFASGVHEALNLLSTKSVDILVADLSMPQTGGEELLHHVAKHHPQTGRIVLSGQINHGHVKHLAHHCLQKPILHDELRLCVERFLESRRIAEYFRNCAPQIKTNAT